jgi:hypothetical protein
MSTKSSDNDAQRDLEQRALRNVRGLVDKMEGLEELDTRTQRRYLVGIVLGAVVVVAMLAGLLWYLENRRSETVVIDTAKTAPVQPAPR